MDFVGLEDWDCLPVKGWFPLRGAKVTVHSLCVRGILSLCALIAVSGCWHFERKHFSTSRLGLLPFIFKGFTALFPPVTTIIQKSSRYAEEHTCRASSSSIQKQEQHCDLCKCFLKWTQGSQQGGYCYNLPPLCQLVYQLTVSLSQQVPGWLADSTKYRTGILVLWTVHLMSDQACELSSTLDLVHTDIKNPYRAASLLGATLTLGLSLPRVKLQLSFAMGDESLATEGFCGNAAMLWLYTVSGKWHHRSAGISSVCLEPNKNGENPQAQVLIKNPGWHRRGSGMLLFNLVILLQTDSKKEPKERFLQGFWELVCKQPFLQTIDSDPSSGDQHLVYIWCYSCCSRERKTPRSYLLTFLLEISM